MTSQVPTQQVTAERLEPSLARDLLHATRYYLLSRTGLIAVGAVAIVAGAALNWEWLIASGVAPLLITLLPCTVMCGLGLCFHKLAGGSCAQEQSRAAAEGKRAEEPTPQLDLFGPAPSASAEVHDRGDAPEGVSRESQSSDERRHTHA